MKKLLSILAAVGLTATASTSVVACTAPGVFTKKADITIENNTDVVSYKASSIKFYPGAKMLGVDPDSKDRDITPGKEIVVSKDPQPWAKESTDDSGYDFHIVRADKANTKLDSIYNKDNDKFKVRMFLDEKWSLDSLTHDCEIEYLRPVKVVVKITGLTDKDGKAFKAAPNKKAKPIRTERFALIRTYKDNGKDDGQKQPPLDKYIRVFKVINYIDVPVFE